MSDPEDRTPSSPPCPGEAQTLLVTPPLDGRKTVADVPTKPLVPFETSVQFIASYEILEELGRGGMGIVYKARQPRLNWLVALKMIRHGEHAGETERRRFLSEAESLAGQRLASASGDQTVKLWDTATGQEVLSLKGHSAGVASVMFSPDGNRLASTNADQTIRIWEVQPGRDPLAFRGSAWLSKVWFSPDSQRLSAEDPNGKQWAWELSPGQALPGTSNPPGQTRQRSPDGRLFAVLEGMVVRVHRLPTGNAEERAEGRGWVAPDHHWHKAQARTAWQEGDWFVVVFHLQRLLSSRPWDARLQVELAPALRQLDRRTAATIHTLQAFLLSPHVSWQLPPSGIRPVMPSLRE